MGPGPRIAAIFAVLAALLIPQRPAAAAPPPPQDGDAPKLEKYTSRFYTVYTNLSPPEARLFVLHMDATFAAYKKMFSSFHPREEGDFPLYLLDTRQNYIDFMASMGINATYTGGIFFVAPKGKGLATYTEGPDRPLIFHTLQHEGFHQFAYTYIGPNLPLWVNEGLAEYFGYGILVNDQLYLGSANATTIDAVRTAIHEHKDFDFDKLVAMASPEWRKAMADRPDHGALLYEQSWSIVHFLVHGDGGKYTQAFEKYLRSLSQGQESGPAFNAAFGSNDTAPFRARWVDYMEHLNPDPLSTAVTNLQFLGLGLQTLSEKKYPMPHSFPELEHMLKQGQFTMTTHTSFGRVTVMSAANDEFFQYTALNGTHNIFRLLEPSASNLLPRLEAPGMVPEPTLVWRRNADGHLVRDIDFK